MTGPQDSDPAAPADGATPAEAAAPAGGDEQAGGGEQADGGEQAVIAAIHTALAELDAARDRPVAEHVRRFEAVHSALTDALSTADTYLSGTSGDRS
ncbi:hypothetical protein [Bounagaea algeriensis]